MKVKYVYFTQCFHGSNMLQFTVMFANATFNLNRVIGLYYVPCTVLELGNEKSINLREHKGGRMDSLTER